jgi:hypothetical protein
MMDMEAMGERKRRGRRKGGTVPNNDHLKQRFNLVFGKVGVDAMGCRGKDGKAGGDGPAWAPAA